MAEWYQQPYPKNPNPPQVSLPRTLYPPKSNKGFYNGQDVTAMKRAVSRLGRWPWNPSGWDDGYADTFAFGTSGNVKDTGVKGVQRQSSIDQTGILGKNTFELLRTVLIPEGLNHAGEPAFDATALNLLKGYSSGGGGGVPDLGPVMSGGKSVLDHDLTHATGGIPLYPAFDDAFTPGTAILAPEALTVSRASSSSPGDAFYAQGDSKIDYWFGHLVSAPPVGAHYAKGAKVGVVLDHNVGGGPHVHVGVNVERLWGSGRQLSHRTDYQHGAPTVGAQLEAGHPL
jgi:hypothetical protein